eukprot:1159278-Pelagomonas_calceolata.AAC.1
MAVCTTLPFLTPKQTRCCVRAHLQHGCLCCVACPDPKQTKWVHLDVTSVGDPQLALFKLTCYMQPDCSSMAWKNQETILWGTWVTNFLTKSHDTMLLFIALLHVSEYLLRKIPFRNMQAIDFRTPRNDTCMMFPSLPAAANRSPPGYVRLTHPESLVRALVPV